MTIYLIGGKALFDSNDSYMTSVSDAGHKVLIGSVAGRCFKALLDGNGEVVKKRSIIEKAWGSFGLEVTDNSLVQAIRQMRLAMKAFDLPENALSTVPRIGYTLTVAIEVVPGTNTPAARMPPVNSENRPVAPQQRSRFKMSQALVAGISSIIGFGLGLLVTMTTAST
ncbi:hypothetical protein BLL42_28345 (plasmid) [Pseudomonas frederiksbergensis]|uniref:OmpR/PhoB-type domain-containing protein n=1 Tax=Pseudomonas frederiksbergensis TaxID=104087 RepID=A0A1J0EUZ1_9PSED|nr:winged helix-turn-helix domain-containing protein [Pseudomonas frederiksbergensis]APC19624.1 hypothetical protein BLL42_28345 [Pseudomonas frederiksbergensis]